MPRYDTLHFDPPAPVASVTVRTLAADRSISDVHLLIDTGADVTLLPREAITRLHLKPQTDTQYELTGFDGTRSSAEAVDAEVLFCGKAFRGRYLLTESASGILGRDVLAALRLVFDAPMQEWST